MDQVSTLLHIFYGKLVENFNFIFFLQVSGTIPIGYCAHFCGRYCKHSGPNIQESFFTLGKDE